jgi:hypothetical protein
VESSKDVSDGILKLVPQDGTPVLNRVLRVMLGRQLGRAIDPDEYFRARDCLQEAGQIGVTRGQGGKVFYLAPAVGPPVTEPKDAWSEAALMQPLSIYLHERFPDELDLPEGSTFVVQDVSRAGPREGQWTRPDFVLVSVMKLKFMPQHQLDTHTFELKAEYGGSVQAVHEALAQTRFS